MMVPIRLEKAGRDVDLEFRRKALHRLHRRMLTRRQGASEVALVLSPAEITAFEQFGREDQLGALASRVAHQLGDGGDILLGHVREGELKGGNFDLAHFCSCFIGEPAG